MLDVSPTLLSDSHLLSREPISSKSECQKEDLSEEGSSENVLNETLDERDIMEESCIDEPVNTLPKVQNIDLTVLLQKRASFLL